MQTFLHSQAPKIAAQVSAHLRRLGKDDISDEQIINQILDDIDFRGWSVLAGDVEPLLSEITKDGSIAALKQIHFDTQSDPHIFNVIDDNAQAYAESRGAELVGMRKLDDGTYIPNPDAKWQITDSTREFLRKDVSQAMYEGWSNDKLAREISDSYGFSKERATMIARTETNFAASQGALKTWKTSGFVESKQWLTAEDDMVSEECEANGEAGDDGDGIIPIDDDYPSGDDAPPVHPNCRCAISPIVNWDDVNGDEPTTGEES